MSATCVYIRNRGEEYVAEREGEEEQRKEKEKNNNDVIKKDVDEGGGDDGVIDELRKLDGCTDEKSVGGNGIRRWKWLPEVLWVCFRREFVSLLISKSSECVAIKDGRSGSKKQRKMGRRERDEKET